MGVFSGHLGRGQWIKNRLMVSLASHRPTLGDLDPLFDVLAILLNPLRILQFRQISEQCSAMRGKCRTRQEFFMAEVNGPAFVLDAEKLPSRMSIRL